MTTNSIFNIPYSTRSGFTLVETLIAIAILLIAVVGPISIIGDALHKLYYAKDEMIAINLAQEGIEVVRWKRDSNMLTGAPTLWDTGLETNAGGAVKDYVVNAVTSVITACVSTPCEALKDMYVTSSGFFVPNSALPPSSTKSQFTRKITISGTGDERKVTSTVTWMTGGQAGTITVTEYLFKWAIP